MDVAQRPKNVWSIKTWSQFSAAMSSSRSDIVTQFVRPFVRPFVMKEFFFSLRSYNGVQGSLIGVSMKYEGYFMQVSWIGSFKGVF